MRRLTVLVAALAMTATLAGCSTSENPTPLPSTASAAPVASPSAGNGSPTPTAPTKDDPTWVRDAEYIAWPATYKPFTGPAVDKYGNDAITRAWREMVVFSYVYGWDNSTMLSSTSEDALALINPYLTASAAKKFRSLAEDYTQFTTSTAGLKTQADVEKVNTAPGATELGKNAQTMGALISFGNPNFTTPENSERITTGFNYSTGTATLWPDGDGIALRVQTSIQANTKDNAIFAPGLVTYLRDVTYYLQPNTSKDADPGIPWLIADWKMNDRNDTDTAPNPYYVDHPGFYQGKDGATALFAM
jgi:hypothetical protein